MEWLRNPVSAVPVTAVLFDFDGTISTLRCGWEEVMEPLMVELIAGIGADDETVRDMVRKYIDESTGIQTIFQMKWLAEQVRARNPAAEQNPWVYKAEYNHRLMVSVMKRRQSLSDGSANPEDFIIRGSRELLKLLTERGVSLYVASGTDDADVKQEVAALGLSKFFTEIKGAPESREDCSKESVIRELIEGKGIPGEQLSVVGDGKVEIAIGRENAARTLGVASNEKAREGVDSVKRARLIKAGADVITGDFLDIAALEKFFFGGTGK